ncbi:ABC transporter ATP-binding protein [Puia sp. P3]|uniref:ABC transporter ATP-binding protein n=1 Tax=Puia sp. P3 TaxID=3423952 RepID=UPI003D665A5E
MNSQPAILAENITKRYPVRKGFTTALDRLSLSVSKGEIFGLIGSDGAGKTSLFRILTTVLLSDEGQASVNGWDVVRDYRRIRQCVGYMPGRFSLYQDLSVEENLKFFAAIFDTDIHANLDLIKDIYAPLEPFRTRRAGQLSGGMKQKLALSCALVHRPEILFLDEPTTGVDAVSRKEFWEMLGRLKRQGITIMVSTAYMDEAGLCDRVALLQNGKLLSIDTPDHITRKFDRQLWAIRADEMYRLLTILRTDPAVESCYPFGQYHHVILNHGDRELLENLITKYGLTGATVTAIPPKFEDCFIRLMQP